jgi:Protein of unknown function (DUF1254)
VLETVTPETYIRAETDRSFHNIVQLNGGAINTFYHFREPTPLDKQTVVRMNKDTLYSGAIVDTSGGATVTLPHVPDGRYMSILLVDNDHYSPRFSITPAFTNCPRTPNISACLFAHSFSIPTMRPKWPSSTRYRVRWSSPQRAPTRFRRRTGTPHR